jgi:hypothetical protein
MAEVPCDGELQSGSVYDSGNAGGTIYKEMVFTTDGHASGLGMSL